MAPRRFTLKELIEAAAKPHRELWWDDDRLKLQALARHYKKKGHPVSGATFSRIFANRMAPGEDTLLATHYVFRLPMSMLRGEPVSAEMEELLTRYHVSTLLLARKLESLPKDDYHVICQQIERAVENAERLKEAMKSGGVVPIDRSHRK